MRLVVFGQNSPYTKNALLTLVKELQNQKKFLISAVFLGENNSFLKPLWRNAKVNWNLKVDCPVLKTKDINNIKVIQLIKQQHPELGICFGYNKLFSTQLLQVPTKGILNLHPSLLPQYKGPSPLFWLLKNLKTQSEFIKAPIGVTLHEMIEKADSGRILMQKPLIQNTNIFDFNNDQNFTKKNLWAILGKVAGQIAAEYLLLNKTISYSENKMVSSYYSRPKTEDYFIDSKQYEIQNFRNFLAFTEKPYLKFSKEIFQLANNIQYAATRFPFSGEYLNKGGTIYFPLLNGMGYSKLIEKFSR